MKKSFTLIEILITVSIIAVIASLVLVALNPMRARARDGQRKAMLKQLEVALERYYSINKGYPNTSMNWYSSEPDDCIATNSGNWIPGLAPGFINALPRDPIGGNSKICTGACNGGLQRNAYVYVSNGVDYKLISHCTMESLAPSPPAQPQDPFYDPVRSVWAWQVHSSLNSATW